MFLLLFPVFAINAEQKEFLVSGTVLSEDNLPLPGVNFIIKGTAKGTVTDFNGDFSLVVPSENIIFYFSKIGYHTREIMIGTDRVLKIKLMVTKYQLPKRTQENIRKPDRETYWELIEKARKDMKNQIEPDWEAFCELMEKAQENIC